MAGNFAPLECIHSRGLFAVLTKFDASPLLWAVACGTEKEKAARRVNQVAGEIGYVE